MLVFSSDLFQQILALKHTLWNEDDNSIEWNENFYFLLDGNVIVIGSNLKMI